MPTPYPTWDPGFLAKTNSNLIQVPEWIVNLAAKDWCAFCAECFKQGYFTGWTNATDQFREAKLEQVVKYVLEQKNAPGETITKVIAAVNGSLA